MSNLPAAIGRYEVRSLLGAGAFATVYLAEDPRLDARVAVKVLAPNLAADVDVRMRFIEEARVMRRLARSGLVAVHDIDEHEGSPYFVMEHCDRGTLAARLERLDHPLAADEARSLANALCRSLRGIHEAGVVHRDLKPSNYLIRSRAQNEPSAVPRVLADDEELVVGDFGLARYVDADRSRLTMAGGTPGYGAPEQFRGDPTVDERADIYALSAIVARAATGLEPRPFASEREPAFAPEALSALGPLGGALARGLAPDRELRPHDLEAWSHSLGPGPGHDAQRSPARTTVRKGRARWVGALAALTAILVGGLVAWTALRSAGPAVLGPQTGTLGDEVVFATRDGTTVDWSVNGSAVQQGASISFRPSEPGVYTVAASDDDGTTTLDYTASPGATALQITGPGSMQVGQPTTLTLAGNDGTAVTWHIGENEFSGVSIEVEPAEVGVVVVEVATSDGTTARRAFTVTLPP